MAVRERLRDMDIQKRKAEHCHRNHVRYQRLKTEKPVPGQQDQQPQKNQENQDDQSDGVNSEDDSEEC